MSPLRIIHVDDEECLLEMGSSLIRRKFTNVAIQTFQDSNEAWRELSQTDPDLLITDDKMPGLTGEDLVQRLTEKKVRYPIIVTSGWPPTKQWVREYSEKYSNVSFLSIPFTSEQFYKELCLKLGSKLQCQNSKPEEELVKRTQEQHTKLEPDATTAQQHQTNIMLTDAQQAHMDDVFARAGKPSAILQRQIDQIRAAETEAELREIFSRDANTVRPQIEAELLCVVMLAKQAELNPSINAKSLQEEQQRYAANQEKVDRLHAATATHFVIAEIRKAKTEAALVAIVDRMDFNVDVEAAAEAAYTRMVEIKKEEKPWWKRMMG